MLTHVYADLDVLPDPIRHRIEERAGDDGQCRRGAMTPPLT
jgi:hypothetical protein